MGNQLTTLPPELAECSKCAVLDIARNRIREFPPVLRGCHALTELYFGGNDLRTFPSELLEFRQLKILSLAGNGICEVPPEIGVLRKLHELRLAGNRLKTLPKSLRKLPKLEILHLHNNDALGLPPQVLGPTWDAVDFVSAHPASAKSILDYYFSRRAAGAKALDEVKMIFAGRGGSGKTSLVNRLVFDRFRKNEKETPCIAITDWTMNDCPGGGPVLAHVWDFAGQVITHAMHQFFFSTRTVYVLVLTGRENAEYWLRLIAAFGTEREASAIPGLEHEIGPPVIIALNKWDDPGSARARLDRAALCER